MGKKQTITINADVIATLKGMDKVVTGLKSGLSEANTKIDFTKGVGASVSKLVDKFKNEFSKFNQLTDGGKLDIGNAKEALKSGQNLIGTYKELQRVIGDLNSLTVVDAKKLFPDAFNQTVENANQKLKDFSNNWNKISEKQLKLDQVKTELQVLTDKLKELEKSLVDTNTLKVNTTSADQKVEEMTNNVKELKKELKEELKLKVDTTEKDLIKNKQKRDNLQERLNRANSTGNINTAGRSIRYKGATLNEWEKGTGKASNASPQQKVGAINALQNYSNITNELDTVSKKIKEQEKEIENFKTVWASFDSIAGEKLGKELAKMGFSTDEIAQVQKAMDATNVAISEQTNARQKLAEAETENARIEKEMSKTSSGITQKTQEIKQLEQVIENLKTKVGAEGLKKALKDALDIDISDDLLKSERGLENLKNQLNELDNKSLSELIKNLSDMGINTEQAKELVEQLTGQMGKLGDSAKDINRANQEMEQLKNQVLQFFSIGNGVQLFKRAVQSAIATVKELDATMTETATVTDFSVSDMWEQLPTYSAEATKLGAKINDLYAATTLYYQQGLNNNQSMAAGIETMKMARIASMDATEATNLMTAALRGFNMEVNEVNATRVNDVYSELAAITAADTQEIGVAMSKTASIANSANMEFETTAALLSQIIETTREAPETAGTAMKTIIARFTEMKKLYTEEQLTSGIDAEGEAFDINKIDTALKSVGMSLQGFMTGTQGIDDVLLELASKWDTLDISTQRYIATQAAGSRQQSRFLAMMSNYDRTMELVDAAYNSAGSSQEQFDKTLESLESKLNKLKNAWDQFTMGLANDEAIKFCVDALTKILETINSIIDGISGGNGLVKSITSLGMAFGAFKIGKTLLGEGGIGAKFRTFLGKGSEEDAEKAGKTFAQNVGDGVGKGIKNIKGSGGWKEVLLKKVGLSKKIPKDQLSKSFGLDQLDFSKVKPEGLDKVKDNIWKQVEGMAIPPEIKQKIGASLAFDDNINTDFINKQLEGTGQQVQMLGQDLDESGVQLKSFSNGMQAISIGCTVAGTALQVVASIMESMGASDEAVDIVRTLGVVLMALGPIIGMVGSIYTASAGAATGAQTALNASMYACPAVWIAAAIMAVIATLVLLVKAFNNAQDAAKMEKLNESIDAMNEEMDAAKQKIQELTDAKDELASMQDTFSGLTEGTKAWKEQLIAVNQKVLDLIEKYPELKLTKGEFGQLDITDESWDAAIKKQNQRYAGALSAKTSLNIEKLDLQTKGEWEKTTNWFQKAGLDLAKFLDTDWGKLVEGTVLMPILGGLTGILGMTFGPTAGLIDARFGGKWKEAAIQKSITGGITQEQFTDLAARLTEEGLYAKNGDISENSIRSIYDDLGLSADTLSGVVAKINEMGGDFDELGAAVLQNKQAQEAQVDALVENAFAMSDGINKEFAEGIKNTLKQTDYSSALKQAKENITKSGKDLNRAYAEAADLYFDEASNKIYSEASMSSNSLVEVSDDLKKTFLAGQEVMKTFSEELQALNKLLGGLDKDKQKTANRFLSEEGKSLTQKDIDNSKSASPYSFNFSKQDMEKFGWKDKNGYTDKGKEAGKIAAMLSAEGFDDTSKWKEQGFIDENGFTDLAIKLYKQGQEAVDLASKALTKANDRLEKLGLNEVVNDDKLSASAKTTYADILQVFSANKQTEAGKNLISDLINGVTDPEQKNVILETLGKTSLNDIDAVKELPETFKELGIEIPDEALNNFITQLEELGIATKQIDVSKISDTIKQLRSITQRIKSGDQDAVFSEEDYKALIEKNPELASKFIRDLDQNYVYVGGTMETLVQALNNNTDALLGKSKEQNEARYKAAEVIEEQRSTDKWNVMDYETTNAYSAATDKNSIKRQALANTLNELQYSGIDLGTLGLSAGTGASAVNLTNDTVVANLTPEQVEGFITQLRNIYQEKDTYKSQTTDPTGQILADAKLDGLNTNEILQYADGLQIAAGVSRSTATQIGVDQQQISRGYQTIADNYDNWVADLNSGDLGRASVATKGLRSATTDLLGDVSQLPDSWFTANEQMDLFARIAKGDTKAINELRASAAKQITIQLGINSTELDQLIDNVASEDIKVGAKIDESQFASSLLTALKEAGATTEQIQSLFNKLGWEPELDYVPMKFSAAQRTYGKSLQEVQVPSAKDPVTGQPTAWTTKQLTGNNVSEIAGDTDVRVPVIRSKNGSIKPTTVADSLANSTNFVRSSNSSSIKKPTINGSNSSSKKEDTKTWKNPYDEYYNTTEKINELLRQRNKLENEFGKLASRSATTTEQLNKNLKSQLKNLEDQIKSQKTLISGKRKQLQNAANATMSVEKGKTVSFEQAFKKAGGSGSVTRYGKYNEATGQIEIDWAGLEALQAKDAEQGEAVEAYISYLEDISGELEDAQDALIDIEDNIIAIVDAQLEARNELTTTLREALIQQYQNEIDKLSELNDTINESNSNILNGIQESVDLSRQIRDNTETEQDIAEKEAKLAFLRRDTSGANDLEIKQLEEELKDARQSYSDTLVDQELDRLSKQNDDDAEARQKQIDLMQKQLDYWTESGYFNDQVNAMIEAMEGSPLANKALSIWKEMQEYDAKIESEKIALMKEWNELWKKGRAGSTELAAADSMYKGEKYTLVDASGASYGGFSYDSATDTWSNGNISISGSDISGADTTKNTLSTQKDFSIKNIPTGGNSNDQTGNNYPYGKASETSGNIKQGARGNAVKAIQYALNQLGFGNSGTKSVDGIFGSSTAKAVRAFQRAMGIKQDGIVGSRTREKFRAKQYKTGGLADYTGMAWLDGTKSKPELVLNAKDTENFITLKDILSDLFRTGASQTKNSGDNYYDFHITVEQIADDYDVERMIQKVKDEINKDATYRNVNSINFMR